MNPPKTKAKITAALKTLTGYIGRSQMRCIHDGLRGEEREFFADKLCELASIIDAMPHSYQTDGQGESATAHLHYFAGGQANWYITEKDKGSPDDTPEQFQSQAFGLADLFDDGGEMGYISIPEILANGGELDMYWTPKTLLRVRTRPTGKVHVISGFPIPEAEVNSPQIPAWLRERLAR